MPTIILLIVLGVVAAAFLAGGFISRLVWPFCVAAGLVVVGIVFLILGTFYQNSTGEAKVVINSIDRTVTGTVTEPKQGWKSLTEEFVEFDLFSQSLTFAGKPGEAPEYSGGSVNGAEVTVNVGGVSGGSTRAQVDFTANYYLSTKNIKDIYKDYRSQELFTEQVIVREFLSIARNQSAYTATEFRGGKQTEAAQAVEDKINEKLKPYGVEFRSVTIQDVRFPANVEESLNAIEQANQKAQEAEANQRTKAVEAETKLIEAQGQAQADIEKARGEAEANKLLSNSLTPEVLEQRKIDALIEAAKGGNLIVDGGGSGLLLNKDFAKQ